MRICKRIICFCAIPEGQQISIVGASGMSGAAPVRPNVSSPARDTAKELSPPGELSLLLLLIVVALGTQTIRPLIKQLIFRIQGWHVLFWQACLVPHLIHLEYLRHHSVVGKTRQQMQAIRLNLYKLPTHFPSWNESVSVARNCRHPKCVASCALTSTDCFKSPSL